MNNSISALFRNVEVVMSLQDCPREVRRLLSATHCHDLDFVNIHNS